MSCQALMMVSVQGQVAAILRGPAVSAAGEAGGGEPDGVDLHIVRGKVAEAGVLADADEVLDAGVDAVRGVDAGRRRPAAPANRLVPPLPARRGNRRPGRSVRWLGASSQDERADFLKPPANTPLAGRDRRYSMAAVSLIVGEVSTRLSPDPVLAMTLPFQAESDMPGLGGPFPSVRVGPPGGLAITAW